MGDRSTSYANHAQRERVFSTIDDDLPRTLAQGGPARGRSRHPGSARHQHYAQGAAERRRPADPLVEEAREAGIEPIVFVAGRAKQAIEDYFDRQIELEAQLLAKGKTEILATMNAELAPAGAAPRPGRRGPRAATTVLS